MPGGRGVAAAGGRGGGRSPSPSIPKMHQSTQLFSSRKVAETSYHASPLSRSLEEAPTKSLQQLSIQVEGTSGQAIKHIIPSVGSRKSMRFPIRLGKGTTGTKCIVKANHFFTELPDKDLHHYDVIITPEVTSRSFNRDVINKLVKIYGETDLGKRLPAYDGRKCLYTAGPLSFATKEFQIIMIDEDEGPGGSRREKPFRVQIKFATRIDLHQLEMFLSGRQADAPQEALQVLDIVLRELPSIRYSSVARSFYENDSLLERVYGIYAPQ